MHSYPVQDPSCIQLVRGFACCRDGLVALQPFPGKKSEEASALKGKHLRVFMRLLSAHLFVRYSIS